MKSIFRILTCACLLLTAFHPDLNGQKGIPKNADILAGQVLDNLYAHSGFSNLRKPKIVLSTGKNFGALYRPQQNEILIEVALLEICRSFKEDSLHALAFILAHELSHALIRQQDDKNPANFLSVYADQTGKLEEEKNSDIYGLFLAFISGYAPDKVLNQLIDRIYASYSLTDNASPSYPSKEERKKSDLALLEKVNPLIQLFEAANLLTLKKEFVLAAQSYEHILKFYKGPEIYNNLGVIYTLKAMELFDEDLDRFSYPVELDLNTGLKKIKRSRGSLTDEMRSERNNFLIKARSNFEKALQLNHEYHPATSNLICSMLLKGETDLAIQYTSSKAKFAAATAKKDEFQMALGIAYALNHKNKAKEIFSNLSKSSNEKTKRFAQQNLQVLRNTGIYERPTDPRYQQDCKQWTSNAKPDNELFRNYSGKPYPIGDPNRNLSFSYAIQNDSQFYLFNIEDQRLLSIERVRIDKAAGQQRKTETGWSQANLFWVHTPRGAYVECESSGILYLLGNKNRFLEEISVRCY